MPLFVDIKLVLVAYRCWKYKSEAEPSYVQLLQGNKINEMQCLSAYSFI